MTKKTQLDIIKVEGYTIKKLSFSDAQKITKMYDVDYPWYTFKKTEMKFPSDEIIACRMCRYILENSTPKLNIMSDIPVDITNKILKKLLTFDD